jgi:hypothetical protein
MQSSTSNYLDFVSQWLESQGVYSIVLYLTQGRIQGVWNPPFVLCFFNIFLTLFWRHLSHTAKYDVTLRYFKHLDPPPFKNSWIRPCHPRESTPSITSGLKITAVQWLDMMTSQVNWTYIFKKTWQKFDGHRPFLAGHILTGDRSLFRALLHIHT